MANETNEKPIAEKTKKEKAAKPKKEKKRGRIRETFSELKKVTWPSFATVIKQTGIVLGVVLAFLVVMIGFDQLLGLLYRLLVDGIQDGLSDTATAAVAAFTQAGAKLWR